MRTVALHLASLSLVFAPVLLHAVETRSTSLNVSLDASVCTALPKGGCNTCDACCADYSESECADCVAAECSGYRCVGVGDALCNVCDTCCNKPWLVTQHACDACVYATCDVLADICHERGTMENPVQCSSKCWGDCVWSWPPTLKAPCLEACIASPTFLLVCAVFALRMLESLWCGIKRGLCGLKRNKITQFRTCIDRPYVQLEVRTAKSSGKPILTVFEEDTRRQGFFDYTLAWEKYGETEWKFLLNIDSVTYRRDAFEAQAMCKRLLRKAQKAVPSGAPNPAVQPLNEPGHWDFFLSHGQAAAGDQVKTLCFLLRQAGKTVWYDNEMQCRDTAAMQEGVLNSDCFLLFLSGDPHVVHGSTAHRERTSCQKSPCSLCCNEQSGDGEYSALHSEDHASQLERGDTTSETETAAFAEPVPVEDSYFVVQQTDTVELTDRQRESWIGLRRGAAHFFRNHEPWYKTGGVSYHNSAEMQDRVKAEGEANGVRVVAVEETDAWIQIDNERWLPKNFGLQPLLTRGESEDKWIVDLPDDWPIEVLPYHRNPSWTDPVVITGVSYGARVRAVYQTAKWIQTLDGHWLPKKILKRFDMEAIGQVVWVRDNYGEPWMRGAVMAHDETSFAPLVRPVVKIKGLDGDYRDIFWGDEERAWQHLDVPAYPSTSVGQVVWVKDDEWIPWIHGLVEAHDKVSGAPLVRPVAGRSKALSGGYFAAKWSEEDSLTLHAWHFVTTRPPGYEFGKLTSSDSSWSEAIVDNGLSPHGALARGLVKALFWHLLQPCLYFYVYFDAHLSLEPVQRGFGNAVAVREAIYLLSSLACICVNPAFLLVDYSAPQGALFFAAMYTIAPEKYVALALLDKGGLDKQCLLHMLVFGGPVLDACGLAALGAGIGEGNLPLALAVGYSVTTLIWPVAITALVWLGIKKSVEEWDMSIGPRPLLGALGMIAFVFPLAFLLALASAAGSPMAPTGWSTTTSIVILSALVMLCGCGCEFWMRTFAYDDASKAFGQCCGLCFLLFFLASLSVVVDWIETATLSVCLMVYCFCLYVSGVRTDDTDKKVWGLCCGLLFLVLLVLAIVMRAEAAEASGSSSSDSAEEHSIISTTLVLLVPLLLLPLGRCLCRLDATKRMAAQQSAQQSAQLQAEKVRTTPNAVYQIVSDPLALLVLAVSAAWF